MADAAPATQPTVAIATLWDYDKPDESAARFRAALAAHPAEDEFHLELETQLARCCSLQQKFADAHVILDGVDAKLRARPGLIVARVRYLLERGRSFNSDGQKDKARPLFWAAWELASRAGAPQSADEWASSLDNLAVDAAHMMAIVEAGENQLTWNRRAIQYAEASVDPAARKWLGSLYNNLGWTYHDAKDYPQALECFEKAMAWHEARKTGAGLETARWCVARCLRSLGQLEDESGVGRGVALEEDAAGGEEDADGGRRSRCHVRTGPPLTPPW